MLYFLFVWLILSLICLPIGITLLTQLQITGFAAQPDRISLSLWLGLVVLANALLAMSLVLPLSPLMGAAVAVSLVALSLSFSRTRTAIAHLSLIRSPHGLAAWFALALGVAALTTQPVTFFDTGYYHYGAIQWLNQFGTVPGIALLIGQLGFTTSWFALAAPLNDGLLESRVSAVTNGFVLWIALTQLGLTLFHQVNSRIHDRVGDRVGDRIDDRIDDRVDDRADDRADDRVDDRIDDRVHHRADDRAKLDQNQEHEQNHNQNHNQNHDQNHKQNHEQNHKQKPDQQKLSAWFVVIFFGLWIGVLPMSRTLLSALVSPSTDIPIGFLVGVVGWTMLISAEQRRSPTAGLIPLILAAGAVSIKLTALPLLVISVLFFGLNWPLTGKRLLLGIGTVLALLLPMLIASTMTSGCPLYPSTLFCLPLPWSPTWETKHYLMRLTQSWETWYQYIPAGMSGKLGLLWVWLTSTAAGSARVVIGSLLLTIGFLIYGLPTLLRHRQNGQLWLIGLAIVGIGFYLWQAPLFRMGGGYVLLLVSVVVVSIGQLLAPSVWRRLRASRAIGHGGIYSRLAIMLFVGFVTAVLLSDRAIDQGLSGRLLLPAPLPTVQAEPRQINDVAYWVPLRPKLCWATPLPCALQPDAKIGLRDAKMGIRAGFIRKP